MKRITLTLLMGLMITGHVYADTSPINQVKGLVKDQTGYEVKTNKEGQENLSRTSEDLLAQALTEEAAVKLALLNNPSVQANMVALGVSQADMREAGLLHNPTVRFSSRTSNAEGAKRNNEIEVKQDVLEILFWPLRKKQAGTRFKAAQYEAAGKITDFVKEVRLLYLDWLASRHKNELAQDHFKAEEAALEMSHRQSQAGNINDLQLAAANAAFGKAKIEWLKTQQDVEAFKQRLRSMLGLKPDQFFMEEPAQMPDLPKENIDLKELEKQVSDHRLDLAMKRQEIKALEQSVGLAAMGVLPDLEVGYDQEREASGDTLKGIVVEGQLSLFNRNQARQMGLKASIEVSKHQLEAMEQEDLLQLRLAYQNLMTSHKIVETYKEIMPSYQQMVKETLYEYNFMLKDVFKLLESKQAELTAQKEYVEALKNYWASRAILEDALGTKIPFDQANPSMDQPKVMEHEHSHGG